MGGAYQPRESSINDILSEGEGVSQKDDISTDKSRECIRDNLTKAKGEMGVKEYQSFAVIYGGPQTDDLSPLLIKGQQHSGRLQGSATLFRSRSNPRGKAEGPFTWGGRVIVM